MKVVFLCREMVCEHRKRQSAQRMENPIWSEHIPGECGHMMEDRQLRVPLNGVLIFKGKKITLCLPTKLFKGGSQKSCKKKKKAFFLLGEYLKDTDDWIKSFHLKRNLEVLVRAYCVTALSKKILASNKSY